MIVCARAHALQIGREGADLNFPADLFMSGSHCRIEEASGKFTLTDLNSRNGTYIRGSALQRFKTLKVRNVYFAGSVVPQRYPWPGFIAAGRVARVINVVATRDWVVAWFPRLFEQFAEWSHATPTRGVLDIGAAGFRGFRLGTDPGGCVLNLEFAPGPHSTGVDMDNPTKLSALTTYVVNDDAQALESLRTAQRVNRTISFFSNISWSVWIVLIALLAGGGVLASHLGGLWIVAYCVAILALLYSV